MRSSRGAGDARQPGTVLITGASKGLGRELALAFAAAGHGVIIHGRDEEDLLQVRRDVTASGVSCEIVRGDLGEEGTLDLLERAADAGGVEILVNNAGIYWNESLAAITSASLRRVLEGNLVAPILVTQRLLPIFKRRGSGLVVTINSLAGLQGSDGEAAYCASKHGLRGFTRSFRFEALRDQILVLDVYVGAMNTEMVAARKDPEKCIQPAEAADLIVGLCKGHPSMRLDEVHLGRRRY